MDNKLEKEFKKHLKKVCSDGRLRFYTLQFLVDLSDFYAGQHFTKDNFDMLEWDGKTYEQDIIKDVFSQKEEASAEEVFVYLFKKNVKKIRYSKSDEPSKGYYDFKPQTVGIKKLHASEFFWEPTKNDSPPKEKPTNMSDRQWKKLQRRESQKVKKQERLERRQAVEESENFCEFSYRQTIYHELCHVFELKTFDNQKYIANGMSKYLTSRENNEDLSQADSELSQAQWADKFISQMDAIGYNAISEILNEELSLKIGKILQIQHLELSSLLPVVHFEQKAKLQWNTSSYNLNYDIATFLHLALGDMDEKNLRFNSIEVREKLNNLNISDEKLHALQDQFSNMLMQPVKNDEYRQLYGEVAKQLRYCDKNSTLGIFMGFADNVAHFPELYGHEYNPASYKTLAQAMLIESIKNDTIEKINSDEVVKDKAFFKNLNSTLQTLDNFVLYPCYRNASASKEKSSENHEITKNDFVSLFSVAEFAAEFPEQPHLLAFSELVDVAKRAVLEHRNDVAGLDEEMTFLKDQQELDKRYAAMLNEEDEALKMEEEALEKAREESTYTPTNLDEEFQQEIDTKITKIKEKF